MTNVFVKAEQILKDANIRIASKDLERPWGGFFVIDEQDTEKFLKTFFQEYRNPQNFPLSPKFLIVLPHKKLSWQYHLRRSEVWKLIFGEAGIIKSNTDEQHPVQNLILQKSILLKKEERHRLVGLENPAIIAEIWQHIDIKHLSDENDIIRLQDDFGRAK